MKYLRQITYIDASETYTVTELQYERTTFKQYSCSRRLLYHSFSTEKFIYHKTVDDAVSIKPKNWTETEEWIISPRESKTAYGNLQDSDSVEASGTSSFLELKPLGVSDVLMTISQLLFKV